MLGDIEYHLQPADLPTRSLRSLLGAGTPLLPQGSQNPAHHNRKCENLLATLSANVNNAEFLLCIITLLHMQALHESPTIIYV